MANLLPEPIDSTPDVNDWQLNLRRQTFSNSGFINLGLTNMDNTNIPQISAGSKLEINGSLFTVETNENISLQSSAVNGAYYLIYAIPEYDNHSNATSCRFEAHAESSMPCTFEPLKGGWYNAGNRCIARMTYQGGWINKFVFDAKNTINNTSIALPSESTSKMTAGTRSLLEWLQLIVGRINGLFSSKQNNLPASLPGSPATYGINISGRAAIATNADNATNAGYAATSGNCTGRATTAGTADYALQQIFQGVISYNATIGPEAGGNTEIRVHQYVFVSEMPSPTGNNLNNSIEINSSRSGLRVRNRSNSSHGVYYFGTTGGTALPGTYLYRGGNLWVKWV